MDKIEVTQVDRQAAFDLLKGAAPDGLLDGCCDTLSLVRAFARHRATRTDATPACWLYRNSEGHTCVQFVQGLMDLDHWTEAPLYAGPPATDVAALVEAARALRNDAVMLLSNAEGCAVSHYGFDAETHGMPQWLTDCRTRIVDASAALAPFTKGQNDE